MSLRGFTAAEVHLFQLYANTSTDDDGRSEAEGPKLYCVRDQGAKESPG
jgi:hypothetical protein